MQTKEDLRVQKTKAALNDAFTNLLAEKSFEDISVNEICVRAEIRRATFYKHYDDKNHFLREYIGFLRRRYERNTNQADKTGITAKYYVDYAKRVVNFVCENEKIINHALSSNIRDVIIGMITEKNYHDTCEKLRASVSMGLRLPASVETVSAMMTGGVATAICLWLFEKKDRSIEMLEKELEILVTNVLRV